MPVGHSPSGDTPEVAAPGRASQAWAMLIKRVYEIDPLCCPKCQGQMKVIALIEPPQGDVIEKILRHCGLWHCSRAPPAEGDFVHDGHGQASPDEPRELTLVAGDAIWGEADGFVDAVLLNGCGQFDGGGVRQDVRHRDERFEGLAGCSQPA